MKYVMFEAGGLEYPVLFPDFIKHNDIRQSIGHEVISAGFVSVGSDGNLTAYGESVSLGKKSRPEDSKILNKAKERM